MSYVIFLTICTIWGASFILMNRAADAFSPVTVGGWRVAGATAVLIFIALVRGMDWRAMLPRLPVLVLVGVMAYAWPYAAQPYLVGKHDHGFIGMMVALVPLFTIIFSVPMLGIWPSTRQIIGVGGGLVCMGVIMLDGDRRGIPALDLAIAVSVPMSYALGNTFIKRYLNALRPLDITMVMLAVATLALLPLSLFGSELLSRAGVGPPEEPKNWGIAVAAIAVLGILGTGLAMFAFNHLVLREGPLFAGMVTYIVPLGAVAWSWGDDGLVTPLQLAALAGVLIMVGLVQYGAAQPKARTVESARMEIEPCPQES